MSVIKRRVCELHDISVGISTGISTPQVIVRRD